MGCNVFSIVGVGRGVRRAIVSDERPLRARTCLDCNPRHVDFATAKKHDLAAYVKNRYPLFGAKGDAAPATVGPSNGTSASNVASISPYISANAIDQIRRLFDRRPGDLESTLAKSFRVERIEDIPVEMEGPAAKLAYVLAEKAGP